MTHAKYDLLGIGNAIVDVLAPVDEAFLIDHNLTKGAMALIDADRALYLYGQLHEPKTQSGGSAGNTVAGIGGLGGKGAFIGKVADDELGKLYKADMAKLGIAFSTDLLVEAEPTARSMIVVTPDGERTMNTYLGACVEIGEDDMHDDTITASQIIYFEGYLWDPPRAKDAFRKAAAIAHKAGRKVALTLSDSFCVDRYRAEFLELITNGTLDILLANEAELKSLYETDDFDAALANLKATGITAAVTRSEKGAVAFKEEETVSVPAYPVDRVLDTTGAGDLFATGFLYGLAKEISLEEATKLGCLLASNIIQVLGPRLDTNLADLAKEAGIVLPS